MTASTQKFWFKKSHIQIMDFFVALKPLTLNIVNYTPPPKKHYTICRVKAIIFPVVMYRCQELNQKEGWVLKNWCFWIVVLEILESLGQQVKPVNPKGNQSWVFIGRTDAEAPNTWATWCKEVTHWKRPWCWGRLRSEEGSRRWDSWMGSLTQWTWVWENSRRW